MKFTKYFDYRRTKPDRAAIKDEWIRMVMAAPVRRESQSDGRVKLWGRIEEAGGRYLRVVLLEDDETVHNAFFDRNFEA